MMFMTRRRLQHAQAQPIRAEADGHGTGGRTAAEG